MREALAWLGLDWDGEALQSRDRARHEEALDRLAAAGALYPCRCSRSDVRRAGLPAADGGFRYPGTCRERALPAAGWRRCGEALRLRLPAGRIELHDESGLDLSRDPGAELGDPLLLRRDGALAYQLGAVVDDAALGVTRVVRGRDLAPSTALQVALQRLLDYPTPRYRHHLLLLEERGDKLAKLHGAVAWHALRARYAPAELCGVLAVAAGLQPDSEPEPATPAELLASFDWSRVRRDDVALRWTGRDLVVLAPPG